MWGEGRGGGKGRGGRRRGREGDDKISELSA